MANKHPVPRTGKPSKLSTTRVERAIAEGKKLPPEEMLNTAAVCGAMAARYAPMHIDNTKKSVENPKFNHGRFSHWMGKQLDALRAAAPYYAPRLHAIEGNRHKHGLWPEHGMLIVFDVCAAPISETGQC